MMAGLWEFLGGNLFVSTRILDWTMFYLLGISDLLDMNVRTQAGLCRKVGFSGDR